MPAGYFDRKVTIHSHAQMMDRLKQRTSTTGKLSWAKPVSKPDGTGHQLAEGTDYEIRKTITQDKVMYWAWHARKLLGYGPDLEIAKSHCEAHSINGLKA